MCDYGNFGSQGRGEAYFEVGVRVEGKPTSRRKGSRNGY